MAKATPLLALASEVALDIGPGEVLRSIIYFSFDSNDFKAQ